MKVYVLTNEVNGKQYVGITVQKLQDRFNQHCRYSGMVINKAIQKYGREKLTIEELEECSSLKELRERETYYIENLCTATPNGYNLSFGGEGLADEAREKISKALKGKPKTKEHAENISKGRTGLEVSSKTKKKLREINLGKKYSDETKKKQSESQKRYFKENPGRIEQSRKGGLMRKGAKVSDLTRKKISKTLKGRPNIHTRLTHLTIEDRDSILNEIAAGEKMKNLSERYKVSYDTIKEIKYGRHWLCREG
ncbi:GIY-YIG nuclease family protein [Sporosarcina sp. BP05]|uniref:GIY-YIG nuclease family protein n=1 Tax=Sporosarcina sp. BP05 TaxID=2758726 RepID=UPI0016474C9C|nr:GIY-YIG nuclease family protein [Sporosarcina sp. BP05]